MSRGRGKKTDDTDDKVRVEELNSDASTLEFTPEGLRPGREERLAARVDGKEGRGNKGSERTDGEDETTLALDHAGDDELGDLESCVTGIERGDEYQFNAVDDRTHTLISTISARSWSGRSW